MKNSILLLPSFLSVILAQVDFASICKLPPVRGNCQAALDMWYFNAATDQCEPFTFSGCNGNANKFGNKEDCERICKLRIQRVETQDNIHPITENYVQDCSAPKDAGVQCTRFARAVPNLQYRWYWNQEKFSCLSFKYNGCGGNTNNFATHTLCTKRCQPMDGPVCLSGNENANFIGHSCSNLTCPSNEVCKMGAFYSTCCSKAIENDGTCPDGSDVMQLESKHFALAETCEDLSCPRGFQCIKGTMFARCCSTGKEKPTNPPFSL